jgi:triacylglycerol lipase
VELHQLDYREAIYWGQFVKIAEAMYVPGVINPREPHAFPEGWRMIQNMNVEPVLECMQQKEHIGFVVQSQSEPGKLAIVFRGSKSFLDYVDDFEFALADFTSIKNGGKTERGFTRLYESISFVDPQSGVTESLDSFLNGLHSVTSFVVTGYSLGATLAQLQAVVLSNRRLEVEVYTFASPMVGDREFVKTYRSYVQSSCNIINKPDIIPRLPGSFLGYEYTPDVFEINSLCFHEVKQSLRSFHSIDTYLSTLCLLNQCAQE